ncbi:MAG: ABC transporter permease [Clostridium sp.]|jgi:putative ABC transport system permease protein
MLIENMRMAFAALRANKMRSFLTMLGIIIGIGSVISIVSIGDTMRSMFSSLYKDIGLTQAYLGIGYWVDDTRESDWFTLDDLSRIKDAFGDRIAYMDSAASATAEAKAGRKMLKINFTGVDSPYQKVQPVDILSGRYLNAGDVAARRPCAVLEAASARKLFGSEQAVGRTFRAEIYGNVQEFTVIGVYEKKMSAFQKLMMGSPDDQGEAFIPWTLLTWPNDSFYYCHFFADEAMSEMELNAFYGEVQAFVARLKGREPEDFYMQTAIAEMGQMDSMMAGLSAAVGGIAAISLIVGGIGIMNIMLVSVTERTREIGIRKALGARTRDVLIQFLTESAILSAMGGIIGILLGSGIVFSVGTAIGVQAVIKPGVIVLAVSFSAVVGIFFGLYPASRAAKADPIDALRYE